MEVSGKVVSVGQTESVGQNGFTKQFRHDSPYFYPQRIHDLE